jgi:hypothetical protein
VLVRPDDHVAWQASVDEKREVNTEEILLIAVGRSSEFSSSNSRAELQALSAAVQEKGFTGTVGNVSSQRLRS